MKFILHSDDKSELEKLVKSGMTPVVISQRAQILLKKAENKSSTAIADRWALTAIPLNCGARSIETAPKIKAFLISSAYPKDEAVRKKSPVKQEHGLSVSHA